MPQPSIHRKIPGFAHFGFFIVWACLITFGVLFLENGLSLSFETCWDLARFFLPFILLIGFGIYLMEQQRKIFYQMYRLSICDSLTGSYNHQFLRENLKNIIDERKRPLSVVFLDIDGFKRYNDDFGHLAGDSVLRTLSEVFGKNLSDGEFLARYGGDEFVIVLVRKYADAEKFVRSRANIFKNLTNLSVSVGIAELRDEDTVDSILIRADEDMYRNKKSR